MGIYSNDDAALIPCDGCGEEAAVVHADHASFCADCFRVEARRLFGELFDSIRCCRLLTLANGNHALCLEPYGKEHDHDN